MLYDPSDHHKVAFDRSRLAQEAANRANHARLVAAATQQGSTDPAICGSCARRAAITSPCSNLTRKSDVLACC